MIDVVLRSHEEPGYHAVVLWRSYIAPFCCRGLRAMKVGRWILLVALAGCVLAAACTWLFLWSGDRPQASLTTDTDSGQLKTSAERVAFLARYFKYRGPVRDAAFRIWWQDNSGGWVPGPSDWSVLAVVQVPPADEPKWLVDARPVSDPNDPFATSSPSARLIPAAWGVSSSGTHYKRDGALLVWHPEGVLEFAAQSDLGLPSPPTKARAHKPCACPAGDPLCACF